jgi:outer membrane protein TolC
MTYPQKPRLTLKTLLKQILCILVFFQITGQVIWAQKEGIPFSLVEAQNHAIQNNPERLNALLDVEIADKKVWETTAMGLPQVSGAVDVSVILSPLPTLSFPSSTGELIDMEIGEKANATMSATISQLVFSGPYIVGLQASKAYRKMSENALAKTERDIKSNVASSYYTILLLTETTSILDSSIQISQKH